MKNLLEFEHSFVQVISSMKNSAQTLIHTLLFCRILKPKLTPWRTIQSDRYDNYYFTHFETFSTAKERK